MLDLDQVQQFDGDCEDSFFSGLPDRAGVFLLEMAAQRAEPYLARTADIRRAVERLLRPPEAQSKRLNLRGVAVGIRYRVTGSKFEQMVTHYQQARAYFPRRYRNLVRVRPPAMLKVNLQNEYPRCYVTRTIRRDGGFYFGPFVSRKAAQAFSEGFLDLFKIRRCQIKIRRDPAFPGCMYSQMKMCLAPCFAGCTKEEYDAEVGRVVKGLETGGAQLIQDLEREREGASETLDFERAAALHKRIEKISAVLRGLPGLVRPLEELDVIILQRASEEKTIAVFPLREGLLREPIFLRFGELSSQPKSVEAILRDALDSKENGLANVTHKGRLQVAEGDRANVVLAPTGVKRSVSSRRAATPSELTEHLSLLTRWFYSNPREGEIFFREADWPYRRILRACSRLLEATDAKNESRPARERIRRLNAFSKLHRPPRK